MTTLDPSHIPFPSHKAHDSRQQAIFRPQSSPLHIAAIPDLRFEQSYLRSIAPYLHDTTPSTVKRRSSNADGKSSGEEKHATAEVSVAEEKLRIDWLRVGWITTRDQVISPLLQGALWCVFYLDISCSVSANHICIYDF